MRLLEGQTLKHRLADKSFKAVEILELGSQIAETLDTAHGMGIKHRDINPANSFRNFTQCTIEKGD
jgi:serine/threonine protein kinase